MKALYRGTWLIALLLLASCQRPAVGPLPQRGYLWQRAWTSATQEALGEAARHFDGIVLLGAELRVLQGKPVALRAKIDWSAVQRTRTPCSLALRVAPYGGPFSADDLIGRALVAQAKALLAEAQAAGVTIAEFQLDFDCGQKKLAGYRAWVRAVRAAVQPTPLAITTLPAWLAEREFAALVKDADAFVLQVHSVPLREAASLCDPGEAKAWVDKAGRLGRPFSVALPTYRCVAGYGPDGKLLAVAMDALQPAWPRGTRTLELGARAGELAALVRRWQAARPATMRELLWYRAPVATDLRNWRWPTLAAVMAGRTPRENIEAKAVGENPIDLSLVNAGESDEALDCTVIASWEGRLPSAADALSGWALSLAEGRAVFTPADTARLRLPPGDKRPIGWLRHEKETPVQVEVEMHHAP